MKNLPAGGSSAWTATSRSVLRTSEPDRRPPMRNHSSMRSNRVLLLICISIVLAAPLAWGQAAAQTQTPAERRIELYGFVMTDFGFDFKRVNPDWFDVLRPTKLPSFNGEFGRDGVTFAGVRQ